MLCFSFLHTRSPSDRISPLHWWGAFVLLLAIVMVLLGISSAHAQRSGQQREQLEGVGVTQKLGASIPQDLTFRNEDGETVKLAEYFDGERPVLLTLNYHRCPMLCQIQLRKFATALSGLSWTPGDKFRVLTVDINPDEGPEMARKAQKRYRGAFDQPDAAMDGWHFLTGEAPAIEALADSVGFQYRRLPDKPEQFAHPTSIIFLSGSGKITRYFTTLDPAPGDLRTALVEASNGTIGSVADKVFLACAQFNPDSNSYSASALKVMQYGSVLLTLIMGGALFVFWRRENEQLEAAEEEAFETALEDRA
jgi:protein SCO1/2